MPRNQGLIFAALVTAIMLGCAPDLPDSSIEVKELKYKIRVLNAELAVEREDQIAAKQENNRYWDKKADIAIACDWLLPLCPESLTAGGREAVAKGYGGVEGMLWWLAIGKLLLLAAGLGTMLGSLTWIRYWLVTPAKKTLESARAIIAEGDNAAADALKKAEAACQEAAEATEELERVQGRLQYQLAHLDALDQEVEAKEIEVAQKKVQIKELQEELEALVL